jgi:plasmid maintenance system killer protein
MPPKPWTTSKCLPATDWKHSAETGPDNTSIRINRQWRVCFIWTDAGPTDVEIVDYH